MNRFVLFVCILSVIGGVVLLVFRYSTPRNAPGTHNTESIATPISTPESVTERTEHAESSSVLQFGDTRVRVILADTPAKRTRGLSGTDGLAEGEGMLFIFPEDGLYGFWMKDMRFAIDIIWLDSAWEVVDVAESVSPDSYPASFSPSKPARYVLEVPAGFAKSHNIALGSEAVFLR